MKAKKNSKMDFNPIISIINPFSQPTWSELPPTDESEQEKQDRLRALAEGKRISDEIDADLLQTRKGLEIKQKALKILLLGMPTSLFSLDLYAQLYSRAIAVWKGFLFSA